MNKNNYILFEKNNPKIALIVLYVDVDLNFEGIDCVKLYKSNNNFMYLNTILKEKKGFSVINSK